MNDSPANIPEGVRSIIADALARPIEEVKLESNLMDDLEAESIDFLDIVFKLEAAFGIVITRGALERAARGDMSDEDFAPNGIISARGLERLRELIPESTERIRPGLRVKQIPTLFTVQTFVNIVKAGLASA